MTQRYGVRPGLVEALLILALALLAAPLRGWLAQRFHKLFEREAALYKEIVARIGSYAGQYKDLSDLLHFVEERTTEALGLRKLKIFVDGLNGQPNRGSKQVLEKSKESGWEPVEDDPVLTDARFQARLSIASRRQSRRLVGGRCRVGEFDAGCAFDHRTTRRSGRDRDRRLAFARREPADSKENLQNESVLAALGRMAATVAHEIKNPLSAIKSIAQVMREDESLRNEYERDLGLIVGETDRLSQSVTQLLSFARKESPAVQPLSVDELLRSVVDLFRANAREQGIALDCEIKVEAELAGKCVSALRDALSNLLLNALQATPQGGKVELIAAASNGELLISVQDSGAGVPADLRERIWEPFFTTTTTRHGIGVGDRS